jgi:hypothetical protein
VNPLAAPVLAAAALLVLAGAPKVVRPADTARALRSVGRPVPVVLVRLGGAAEAGLGVVALVAGGRVTSALVAASYLGFTGFVLLALRTGGVLSSCGCLGRPDTPPTRTHVIVTAGFALLAAGAAAGSPVGLTRWSGVTPGDAVALIGYAVLLLGLAWVALAELPQLTVARRPG